MQPPQRNKLIKAIAFIAAGATAAVTGHHLFKGSDAKSPQKITRSEERKISAEDAAKIKILSENIANWGKALSTIEDHLFKTDPVAIERKDLIDILSSTASLKVAIQHALGGYDWVSQSKQKELISLRTRTEVIMRTASDRLQK